MLLRTAVLTFSRSMSPKFQDSVARISKNLEARGTQNKTFDLLRDDQIRLAGTKYGIVVCESEGIFARQTDSDLRKRISALGVVVSGIRTTAILISNSVFKNKVLESLMADLEGEGLFLRNSFIINDTQEIEPLIASLDLTVRGS